LDRRDLVRVPASTMEVNLVTSRVPVYPETAKAMGIEGPVVVEAAISRSGAVEYARAISGDPHLRAAAEEAVTKWRYKPYLINGNAVEAATQVRVVFKLPER
jgi:TonB family protein